MEKMNRTKELTPEQKIEKFLKWLNSAKKDANNGAMGSRSAWNHAYSEAYDEVYVKAKRMFPQPKKEKVASKK